MNKKIKIVGTFSALIISICMLTVGVLAASSVSLSVSSTVSFSASGVYASVSGSIWRGANESSLAQVTENANQTLAETKNFVEGQVSNGAFTGLENGWNPSEVEFSETNKIIEYRLTFKNYSEFPIMVNVTNNSAQGNNITIQELTSGIDSIPADNGTTQATYTLRLTLNNVSQSTNMNIDLSFDISEKTEVYKLKIIEEYAANTTITINENQYIGTDEMLLKEGDYVRINKPELDGVWIINGLYICNKDGETIESLIEYGYGYPIVGWNSFPKLEKDYYIYVTFHKGFMPNMSNEEMIFDQV